jgi:XTP/dITP diphosphohydrolase
MLKEYRSFDILSLLDFPRYEPLPESYPTLEENAKQKALHAAQALRQWTISDDTGLFVPALQGAPGVFSARYAGQGASDSENRKKLLYEMQPLKEMDRQAYFECWIALASPEGIKRCVRGICEGLILDKEKGSKGFGYDPLFVKNEYGEKTFAEMDEQLKNRISHRRKALDKIHIYLESLSDALLD